MNPRQFAPVVVSMVLASFLGVAVSSGTLERAYHNENSTSRHPVE